MIIIVALTFNILLKHVKIQSIKIQFVDFRSCQNFPTRYILFSSLKNSRRNFRRNLQ